MYQKAPCRNASSRAAHTYDALPKDRVRLIRNNSGDECSAYIQYIHDEYDALPSAVIFLQY